LIITPLLGSSIVIDGHQSTIAAISGGSSHPLIYYKNNASVEDMHSIPELSITNLTIDSFNSDYDGGAMSFDGAVDLQLSALTFHNDHSMQSGGALWINHNSFRSVIYNCTFDQCSAAGTVTKLYHSTCMI